MSDLNTNFTVPAPAGITVSVKKVDTSAQDSRRNVVDDSMSKIMNPPGPRDPKGQFPLSGK